MPSKRYRLPDVLGGGELDGTVTTFVGERYVVFDLPEPRFYVRESDLTEVVPPLPAEPDPGAYERNGQIIVGVPVDADPGPGESRCAWFVSTKRRSWFNHLRWDQAVDETGGPDVQITPLVPMPAVELPLIEEWYGRDVRVITRTIPTGDFVHLGVDNDFVHLTDHQAERAGWALIAAARAARDRSETQLLPWEREFLDKQREAGDD